MGKRYLTFALIFLHISVIVSGCVFKAPSGIPSPNSVVEPDHMSVNITSGEPITLSIWYALSPGILELTDNLADGSNFAWAELMRRTGINLEFVHPPGSNEAELFQLMIASKSYPDIYKGFTILYAGGLDKAIDDGVFIRLNELADTLVPNYMGWVNLSEANRKEAYTDSGNMACICMVYDRSQSSFAGYAVRQDWLDDLGLDRPQTYDDWRHVLASFKDRKTTDGAGPLALDSTGIPFSSTFAGGYGVSRGLFIQRDGVISCSQAEEGFRDYLEMMHSWYSDGLIDKDFMTNGIGGVFPNTTRISNNESGAIEMMYTFAGDYYTRAGIAEDGATFTLTRPPTKDPSLDPPITMFGVGKGTLIGNMGAMIFTTCQYPEYALRFIDYMYSDEGAMIANYGVEGETYSIVDGKPLLGELLTNNPDGLAYTTAQERYLIHNGFVVFMLSREEDVQSDLALEYRELWAHSGELNIVGNLTYTSDEGAGRTLLLTDISSYINEMTCKFIMGVEDLSDENWDKYIHRLHTLNVDRLVEITQDAYDRYQNR